MALSSLIVTKYGEYYGPYEISPDPWTTMAAVNASRLPALALVIDNFAQRLMNNLQFYEVEVRQSRNDAETFNVTLNANTTMIAKKAIINMLNGTSTILNFTWDTTGFAKGNYTINAVADVVIGETKIDDNNFTDGWVMLTRVGDLNFDDKCDGRDIIIVARHFGEGA